MVAKIDCWRKVVEQIIDGIADEKMQRRAWFGAGPEIGSPEEMFNQFFDDAAIEDFLKREDNGLSEIQIESAWQLVKLIREFSDQTPEFIDPSTIIDDPKLVRIRQVASHFLSLKPGHQSPDLV